MKIVIDCYGADYSPDELVKGAITSVNLIEDLEIILTGKQNEIQRVIDEIGYKGDKLTIVDSPDVISCDEVPTEAIRKKKINPNVEATIHSVGIILLFALMIIINVRDVIKLF